MRDSFVNKAAVRQGSPTVALPLSPTVYQVVRSQSVKNAHFHLIPVLSVFVTELCTVADLVPENLVNRMRPSGRFLDWW